MLLLKGSTAPAPPGSRLWTPGAATRRGPLVETVGGGVWHPNRGTGKVFDVFNKSQGTRRSNRLLGMGVPTTVENPRSFARPLGGRRVAALVALFALGGVWPGRVSANQGGASQDGVAAPGWVEESREVPVPAPQAQQVAVAVLLGGPGALGLAALVGGPLWAPLTGGLGGVVAHWVAARTRPSESPQDLNLVWTGVAAQVPGLLWMLVSPAVVVGAALLAGSVGALGMLAVASNGTGQALGGAVLVGAAVALGMAVVTASGLTVARHLATLAVVQVGRGRVTPGTALARPAALTATDRHTFLSMVATGAVASQAWHKAIPLVGPLGAALRGRNDVTGLLVTARELTGMPRIRDTLQRDVDVLLIGEALLRTGAWLALPAVLGGLAAGGVGLGVNARLGLVSPGAALALAAAGLGATALVALGGLGLWLTADVVEGFTPVWLASAAVGESLPNLDPRLRKAETAPVRRVITAGRPVRRVGPDGS